VLVGGALVGGGGLVAHERRARVEGERLQAGVAFDIAACAAFMKTTIGAR
jgi:hypothetical protein